MSAVRVGEPLSPAQRALLRLLRTRSLALVDNAMRAMHPADLAELYPFLSREERHHFADRLARLGKLSSVLAEMDEEVARDLLQEITEDQLLVALEQMEPDDATDVLLLLPEERRQKLLDRLSGRKRLAVGRLLGYDPDSAGSIMTTEFVALPEHMTVDEAVRYLRNLPRKPDYFYVYVIDDHQRLVGVVSFRDLVLSDPSRRLQEVMLPDPIVVSADMRKEDAARVLYHYDLLSVPVVDDQHRLLGQITADDAIYVLSRAQEEDLYHLMNAPTEERPDTPLVFSLRRRLFWLLLNLGTAFLAFLVVQQFDATIARFALLAALMPVVAGEGGNAAMQSLAVVVRWLATGEVGDRQAGRVILREGLLAFLNGLLVSLVLAGVVYALTRNLWLTVIGFLALWINMLVAGLVGSAVPLFLRRLGLDPAIGSSILVTTATDVIGFLVLLGLAAWAIGRWVPAS